jgi:hypothetical protein
MLLFLCRPSKKEPVCLLHCCPESCENPSIDRSMPGPPAWDSCRHRTFNSEAGQRFRNYCAGFCSRHCEWAWMTLHRSELRVGFC